MSEQRFSGTGDIRVGQEIDPARLDAWMTGNVEGYQGPLTIEQFKGGQSNPTCKRITPKKSGLETQGAETGGGRR